ncbi:DNA helicase rad5 [Nowakowskiella sp. JEL0407]|nr:DNA helicase rad5 [Nowakowskiella sp. JEL0407]
MGVTENTPSLRPKLSKSLSFKLADAIVDIDEAAIQILNEPVPTSSDLSNNGILIGKITLFEFSRNISVPSLGAHKIKVVQLNYDFYRGSYRYNARIAGSEENVFKYFLPRAPLHIVSSEGGMNSKCTLILTVVETNEGPEKPDRKVTIEMYWDSQDLKSLETKEALKDEFVGMYWAIGGQPFDLGEGDSLCLDEDGKRVEVEDVAIPDTFDVLPCPQPDSPFKVKLYDYQLRTLAWMQGVEDEESSLYYAANIFPVDDDRLAVITNAEIGTRDEIQGNFASVRGGIIADKPGIGKTITTIALCHTRPYETPEDADADYILIPYEGRILSKATLIFAPSNICHQWEKEFRKCLGDSIQILQIKGKPQYVKTGIEEIMNAEIIIVSYSFLQNGAYKGCLIEGRERKFKEKLSKTSISLKETAGAYAFSWFHFNRIVYDEFHEISDRSRSISQQILLMSADKIWGLTGTPRIDNHPEVIRCAEFLNLDPNNVWLHPQIESVRFVRNRVRRNEPDITYPDPIYETIMVSQTPAEFSFYRSCASDGGTVNLLMLCNHYQIMMSVENVTGRRLLNIEDVARLVQDSRANSIRQLTDEIQYTIENIAQMQGNIPQCVGEAAERLAVQIERAQNRLEEIRNKLQVTQGQYNYFQNFAGSYADGTNDTNCAICLEDRIVKQDAGVFPCGHAFCWDCAKEVVRATNECPTCRERTYEFSIMKLSAPVQNVDEPVVKKYYKGVGKLDPNLFGSKIRELVNYIYTEAKASRRARFIVFIQFGNLADIVSEALHTYGLNNVRLKKGWKDRETALRRFRDSVVAEEIEDSKNQGKSKGKRKAEAADGGPSKTIKTEADKVAKPDDSVKVLILSAHDSVSGLNLTEASHCIILHPFHADNEEYAMAAELQGLARVLRHGQKKTVKIVRFVVQNTIEEEIHVRRELIRNTN